MWWNILVSLLLLFSISTCERMDCSRTEYERCVAIADPLVKEAHLIFPDNLDDIDLVCRTWNRFVDCLKAYTENCFTESQRRQFNRAVESPIESVHQMCMQPSYQKEYLRYASCIKSTIIERDHCGPDYNLLVDQVEQGDVISKTTLCCSHDRFKACVQKETRRLCDQGIPDGPAFRFATQTIDKALRFLQDQCLNYIHATSADCIPLLDAATSYSDRSSEPKNIIPASSEVYPWSTIQQTFNEQGYEKNRHENEENVREIPVSRVPKVSTSSWLPSSTNKNEPDQNNNPSPQHLGARSRPSSYGRASSWPTDSASTTARTTLNYGKTMEKSEVGTQSTNSLSQDYGSASGPKMAVNTVPSLSEGGSFGGTPFTNKWGTIEAVANPGSNVKSSAFPTTPAPTQRSVDAGSSSTFAPFTTPAWYPTSSPETWYPAAGFQLTNEVDEPNQMGLIKPKNNSSTSPRSSYLSVVAIGLVAYYICKVKI